MRPRHARHRPRRPRQRRSPRAACAIRPTAGRMYVPREADPGRHTNHRSARPSVGARGVCRTGCRDGSPGRAVSAAWGVSRLVAATSSDSAEVAEMSERGLSAKRPAGLAKMSECFVWNGKIARVHGGPGQDVRMTKAPRRTRHLMTWPKCPNRAGAASAGSAEGPRTRAALRMTAHSSFEGARGRAVGRAVMHRGGHVRYERPRCPNA